MACQFTKYFCFDVSNCWNKLDFVWMSTALRVTFVSVRTNDTGLEWIFEVVSSKQKNKSLKLLSLIPLVLKLQQHCTLTNSARVSFKVGQNNFIFMVTNSPILVSWSEFRKEKFQNCSNVQLQFYKIWTKLFH